MKFHIFELLNNILRNEKSLQLLTLNLSSWEENDKRTGFKAPRWLYSSVGKSPALVLQRSWVRILFKPEFFSTA